MGPEMMQEFRDQAERFGTRFITDDATRVELSRDGGIHRVWVGDQEIVAKTVILAMGAEPKKLGVPGEDELAAKGVSYCATCDAAFFRDKPTIVVGGGDTAMEDATFLVEVRQRREGRAPPRRVPRLGDHGRPRARHRQHRAASRPYVVERFEAGDERLARHGRPEARRGRRGPRARHRRRLHRDRPPAELRPRRGPARARRERLRARRGPLLAAPRCPACSPAGDLVDHVYRQAVTAAGMGCMAALDAEAYLRDTPPDPEAHWAPVAADAPALDQLGTRAALRPRAHRAPGQRGGAVRGRGRAPSG